MKKAEEENRRKEEERLQRALGEERRRQEEEERRRQADAARLRKTEEDRLRAVADSESARREATEAQAELDGFRDADLFRVVKLAVGAVAETPEGLPPGFMRPDDERILGILRTHHVRREEAAIRRASERCAEYVHTSHEMAICHGVVQRAVAAGTDAGLEEAVAGRDEARERHVAAAQALLEACSSEQGLLERVANLNASAQRLALQLSQVLGGGSATGDEDEDSMDPTAVGRAISQHDQWVGSQGEQSRTLCESIKEAMSRLARALQVYADRLLLTGASDSEGSSLSIELADTRPLAVDVLEQIAAQDTWVAGLAEEYEKGVSPLLRRAALAAISDLHTESREHAALISAARSAETVAEDGAQPNTLLLQRLAELSKEVRKARRDVDDGLGEMASAQRRIDNAVDDSDEEARAKGERDKAAAEERYKTCKAQIRRLQVKQQAIWGTVYRLAAAAYPELPSQALQALTVLAGKGRQEDTLLTLVDPLAARLLAPSRYKDMYDAMKLISEAGRDSRNDVFRAVFAGTDVCLKRFRLGDRVGINGTCHAAYVLAVRTLQRELNSVAKLAHDRVIKPALFFLQADDEDRLWAYVEYPWYPCGSMQEWLDTLPSPQESDAPRVRVVLWDAIKAIEHVHYHGIVHCDVKLANVLVELRDDGQHRGVLADFDLSKDLEARKLSSVSMVSMSGARGTPGYLTMAPEIARDMPPDAKSDVFSFGGMVLQVLFPKQAEVWKKGSDADRWDAVSGAPRLALVQDRAARGLLTGVLQQDKEKRPTSSDVVSHSFFSADARAVDLLQTLEQGREELEKQQADYTDEVRKHRQQMQEGQQSIANAREQLRHEIASRQARLDQEGESLKRQRQKLVTDGKRSQEVQEQLEVEERRLRSEREKLSTEKRKQEQELRKREQRHAERKRDEEAKLASERKEIDRRKAELAKKEKEASTDVRVPMYWKNKTGFSRVLSHSVKDALQQFLVQSSACCHAVTSRAEVMSIERIENECLWQMYQTRRGILKKTLAARNCPVPRLSSKIGWQPDIPSAKDLSADVNEFYLFHGTSSATAGIIAEHGFDERVANLGGLYGAGSYFAINACKSHQYRRSAPGSRAHVMLVCRVTMGIPFYTSTQHTHARRAPDNPATAGRPFDSIFAEGGIANGGSQQHNEYVVFDGSQVYPEYVVHYRV
eukprot:Tamp_01879.p1 GENE.Tamp_01879~~Tamp_01879.p1  ORF type:complete len:1262 (+),score=324.47 Tamp_01879:258-3788(+)